VREGTFCNVDICHHDDADAVVVFSRDHPAEVARQELITDELRFGGPGGSLGIRNTPLRGRARDLADSFIAGVCTCLLLTNDSC